LVRALSDFLELGTVLVGTSAVVWVSGIVAMAVTGHVWALLRRRELARRRAAHRGH
jgi:hypothetical protein